MVKDLLKETFEYFVDKFIRNKSAIIKILSISIFLASVTSYSIVNYLAPIIRSRRSDDGQYYIDDMSVLFWIVLILFAFSFLMLILTVVIAFVLNCLKPVYFSFAVSSLIFDMIYIMFVGEVSVSMFISVILSYVVLIWSIRSFVMFAFNRVILK